MNESPGVPIIAVVDDDESVRESLAGLAESVGYEAALFASAEEFLQSARHVGCRAVYATTRKSPIHSDDLHHGSRRSEDEYLGHEGRSDSPVVQTVSAGGFAASRAKGGYTVT